jgi:hypothetical protein
MSALPRETCCDLTGLAIDLDYLNQNDDYYDYCKQLQSKLEIFRRVSEGEGPYAAFAAESGRFPGFFNRHMMYGYLGKVLAANKLSLILGLPRRFQKSGGSFCRGVMHQPGDTVRGTFIIVKGCGKFWVVAENVQQLEELKNLAVTWETLAPPPDSDDDDDGDDNDWSTETLLGSDNEGAECDCRACLENYGCD